MMSVWSCLIFTFDLLKNMKLCPGQQYILGHSAVISDTVYFKAITDGKGINWYFNDEFKAQQLV